MKNIAILFFFCLSHLLGAQTTINQYKIVMVPSSFLFTEGIDQYGLNTLTKLMLEKNGFKTYFDTEQLPDEIVNSRCDKLYATVVSTGNFITTKLTVVLKDCKNQTVFSSEVGKSKEKEYKTAYTQALRQAFFSFSKLNYQYSAITNTEKETVILAENFEETNPILDAQPIANGFQLVDSTSKIVMKIYKSSNSNTFTALKENRHGILISKDNQWFFEYYLNDQLISEKVNVKF